MENIELATQIIKEAAAIVIAAGAGMGVDSGLPDFRGNEGFWKAYPPIAKLGLSFEEMANPQWFEKNPPLAWAFYGHRLNLYRQTTPHQGFKQLLEIGNSKPEGYFVFTSNVDGQFQKAGFDEQRIEECHGSIHHFQCQSPCCGEIWSAADITVNVNLEQFRAWPPLPECRYCGELARPNILMFGDWNWIPDRTDKQSNRFQAWLETFLNSDKKLAVIEMGAGKAVPSVRDLTQNIARASNATLIRINPRDSEVPQGNISIPLGAGEGINKIYELLKKY